MARTLAVDDVGAPLLAGWYHGAASIDGKALPSAAKQAPFFARLAR